MSLSPPRSPRVTARHGGLHSSAAAAAAAAAASASQSLHPSAHSVAPLPSFSHAALGAYQLRIDPQMAAQLMQLRQDASMSLHRKTEMCLQALEALANRCVISHGAAPADQRPEQSQDDHSHAGKHGSSKTTATATATASGDRAPDPQLDGVPLSQHQSALRSTILNLHSMVLPLLAAPRHVFQEALNRAEECAVKHGAIRYETEDRDSVRLDQEGRRVQPDGGHTTSRAAVAAAAAAAASEETKLAHTARHSNRDSRRRSEQRREQDAKLAALDAQLRMHSELLDEEKRVEPDSNIDLMAPSTLLADEEDTAEAQARLSAAAAASSSGAGAGGSGFQHRFLLTRDPECLTLASAVPYCEVVQSMQYMKTALASRLAAAERQYLDGTARVLAGSEEVSHLREGSRQRDMRAAGASKAEAKLSGEFVELRAKLHESYAEVKKARAKNAEMKRDMGKQGGGAGGGGGGGGVAGAKGIPSSSSSGRASHSALAASKRCKKQLDDLVLTLKERRDDLAHLAIQTRSANEEVDSLTTQVEILEQAVQTMRYMVKDILARIYEREDGTAASVSVSGAGEAGPGVAAMAASSGAVQTGEDASSRPRHARRSSTGVLPPVGGTLPSESAAVSSASASSPTASARTVDPRALRAEGVVSTLSARDMIPCRGIGPSVPRFMSYSGWVRRFELGKRHTELIIKEIWSLKSVADENRRKSGLPRTSLQDFFQAYLASRFPARLPANTAVSGPARAAAAAAAASRALHLQMEFVYNFVSSCSLYRSDHDMDLFDAILFGRVSEERYIDQMTMMAHFKKSLTQMDGVDGLRDGYISKVVFFAGLRMFFPIKSEENMRGLIEIVLREMQSRAKAAPTMLGSTAPPGVDVGLTGAAAGSGGAGAGAAGAVASTGGSAGSATVASRGDLAVDISKLMAETSDGDESVFMDAIRSQYEAEVNAFPLEIAAALEKASRAVVRQPGAPGFSGGHARHQSISANSGSDGTAPTPNGSSGGWLPAGQIAAILQELDPNKTSLEIEALMRRGLGLDGFHAAATAAAQAREPHGQVLREHKDASQSQPQASSSRSATPSQHTRSVSGTGAAAAAGAASPAKDLPTSPAGRKLSFNIPSSGVGVVGVGVGVAPISTRRDSFSVGGVGGANGSTPTTPLGSSGSQSSLLSIPHSTTRQHSRMSVGVGLSFASVSPLATSAAPAQIGSPAAGLSAPALGGSVAPASIRSSWRESDRRTHSSGSMRGPHHAHSLSQSYAHARTHSRNMSRSLNAAGAAATAAATAAAATGMGASIAGRSGGSYDPGQFVELSTFLERLNSLFLHRTGHYNANLDIAALAQLIKDELERVADEERKAREMAAAKKGFAGPQVNALALPSWAALWPSYRRAQHMAHVRDEVLRALTRKYSRRSGTSPTPSDDGRPGSRGSQRTMRSHRSQVSLHSQHGRTGSTTSSILSGSGGGLGGGDGGGCDSDVASVVAAELDAPDLIFDVNDVLNRVVTFYRGDATQLQVDGVVNAANPQLVAGGGICAAIFEAAGHAQLSRACAKLGGCAYGHTKVTSGFKLPAKFILHSVSPMDNTDAAALESCYTTILDACQSRGLRSVAMCCLATGICGFRNLDACEIALRTTRRWLEAHLDQAGRPPLDRIVFCVFSEEDASAYNSLLTIFFPCAPLAVGSGAASGVGSAAVAAAKRGPHDVHKRSTSFLTNPAQTADAQESKENGGTATATATVAGLATGAAATASSTSASASSTSPKPLVHRKRSTRHSAGSAAALGLGIGGGGSMRPVVPAAAAATAQAVANLSSIRRKQLAGAARAVDGSASARSLASYKYVYPASLSPPPPPPKTASELFCDSVVAPFVPPQPKPPALPRDGSRDYQLYQAHRSGAGAAAAESHAAVPLTPTAPGQQQRVKKIPSHSLHGLAKLMSKQVDDEQEDD